MRTGKQRLYLIFAVSIMLVLASCGAQHPNRPLLSAPPSAAADNDIYISDAEGRVRALRPDGTEQWSVALPDEIARMDATASRDLRIDYLAARSNGLLFGLATQETGRMAGNTILFALDRNRLLWHVGVPFPEQNGVPVAIGPAAVYEAGDDGVLYAFSRTDGHRLWTYKVSQGALGSPTVGADGTAYVMGPRHNLHAILPDGTQRWVAGTRD
jgi:outer membrane protein assembly factor BamB